MTSRSQSPGCTRDKDISQANRPLLDALRGSSIVWPPWSKSSIGLRLGAACYQDRRGRKQDGQGYCNR